MNPFSATVIIIFGTLIFTLFAFFLIMFVLLQKRKQYRYLLDKQELQHRFQNELLQSRIEVQEQSLQYFSEEIHDNVGQVLSLTKLHLYKISRNSEDEIVLKSVQQSTELLTKAIADLRSISHTANGGLILNADLAEIIQKELSYVSSAKNINCSFNTEGTPYPLGQEKNLLVFRIVQECIANALKHGNAEKIDITIGYQPQRFTIAIADNGAGFDTLQHNGAKGLGLNNMKNRAKLLNGSIDIDSQKDLGTTITLNIPLS